jgi:hypothetical protein
MKLPLQIPFETSVRLKEADTKIPTNKSSLKKEITEVINEFNDELKKEADNFSKGYIKYPAYDFF